MTPSRGIRSSPAVERPPANPDPSTDFNEFYTANVRGLTVQIYVYIGDRAEAEDLVAEAFCRTLARWKTVSDYENPGAWVRRVAFNLATSHLRRRVVAQRFLMRQRETHVSAPGPEWVDLMRALAGLGERHRRAVILRYIAQLSVAEIAAQEGVAEATVRSWLTRGRTALADLLRTDDEREQ